MNDEIKEILDYFKDDIEFLEKELINTNFLGRYITIRDKECGYLKKLLDYITNLQQENQELSRMCELYSKSLYNAELTDYKSRIEKAVEYIQNHQLVFELSSKKVISQWFDMFYKDILNILVGVMNK